VVAGESGDECQVGTELEVLRKQVVGRDGDQRVAQMLLELGDGAAVQADPLAPAPYCLVEVEIEVRASGAKQRQLERAGSSNATWTMESDQVNPLRKPMFALQVSRWS
jgi:hypothetical protein